jgi:hypothetical protein
VDNTYRTSVGEDRYRRGIYTVWRRSSPYPSLVNFDAPDRAACTIRRARTSTPLQALTLLNDPVYVEAAMALAARVLAEVPAGGESQRAEHVFRLALARRPAREELRHLEEVYERELARFRDDPAQARALVEGTGDGWRSHGLNRPDESELAAWFFVASAILNLDETITKG